MKNKYLILVMLLGLSGIFTIQSCKKDEVPTPIVYKAFTIPVMSTSPATRADGTVLFTGSTVDLVWASAGAEGAAQSWSVYFGETDPPVLFKSNVATQKLSVPVVDGTTYYWKVVITDPNGKITRSPQQEFTAVNGSNPDLYVGLTTTTNVKSAIGLDLAADKVVDMRFLVLKASDMSVVKTIDDGIASEEYTDFGSLPDGDYILGVDIFSTINAGDFNKLINLSFSLQFEQLGITDTKLDFPNVMTNANPCNLYRTYLATVNKAGSVYTIASAVSFMKPAVVTWKGTDDAYPSEVTTTSSCSGKSMKGLTFGWMLDYWGEIITSGGTLTYTTTATTITIPLQKYCKTTYNGAAQPEYSISGTGTIDNSGAFPVWTIKYDLIQSGKSILTVANGVPDGYLEAIITTNPAKKSVQTAGTKVGPKH